MFQTDKIRVKLEKHKQSILFALFAILLFIKCLLFHKDAFNVIDVCSFWHNPLSFYKFYMAKLLMPLVLSSFLFITRSYWWTIIVSFLVDIWCVANLIYYKTYDAFLSVYDILLVGNMEGAWSSVTAYFDWYMFVMFALTLLWGILYVVFPKIILKRNWKRFTGSLLVIYLLAYANNFFIYNPKFWSASQATLQLQEELKDWMIFINDHGGDVKRSDTPIAYLPFYRIYLDATGKNMVKNNFMERYIKVQSILSDFFAINLYYILHNNHPVEEFIALTDDEIALIKPCINTDTVCQVPQNNLIVILVESLEDWPLHHEIEGQAIAPCLKRLTQHEHILYCNKITSQALRGNSGDGQMTINTGLLPIQNGVACMHYGNNEYPNFAHFYPNSILVNPWSKIWNQDTMSIRYSYREMIEPEEGKWEDEQILAVVLDSLKASKEPSCIFAITVSTHSPFNRVRNNKITTTAPTILNRYMQCLNYTDSCIGAFMDQVLNDPQLAQSTIVITSDHTIFKPAMLPAFMDYATQHNLSIASGENYSPLIIYSPEIKGNIQTNEICYQMDVFPTILHLIGCEDYYWKGFGVNLLDSVARNNRPITEQEAYTLSEKIIRANYFSTISK